MRLAPTAPGGARARFVLVVGTLLAAVLLTPRAPILDGTLAPLDLLTARVTEALLGAFGADVRREATVLSHPSGFAYEIYWRCTGLLPAIVLAGLILASPGRARDKGIGVAAGVAIMLVMNLIRLAHLFDVGVRHPAAFPLAHTVIWEGAVVLLVLGLWLAWMRWSDARP